MQNIKKLWKNHVFGGPVTSMTSRGSRSGSFSENWIQNIDVQSEINLKQQKKRQ